MAVADVALQEFGSFRAQVYISCEARRRGCSSTLFRQPHRKPILSQYFFR